MPDPATPDEIDALLASADYYDTGLSEAAEEELARQFRAIRESVGTDAFRAALISLLRPHAARWRREAPDHPGLRLIDDWRSERA